MRQPPGRSARRGDLPRRILLVRRRRGPATVRIRTLGLAISPSGAQCVAGVLLRVRAGLAGREVLDARSRWARRARCAAAQRAGSGPIARRRPRAVLLFSLPGMSVWQGSGFAVQMRDYENQSTPNSHRNRRRRGATVAGHRLLCAGSQAGQHRHRPRINGIALRGTARLCQNGRGCSCGQGQAGPFARGRRPG